MRIALLLPLLLACAHTAYTHPDHQDAAQTIQDREECSSMATESALVDYPDSSALRTVAIRTRTINCMESRGYIFGEEPQEL